MCWATISPESSKQSAPRSAIWLLAIESCCAWAQCGHCAQCLSGQDNLCPAYSILGHRINGGLAQYVNVPAANALAMPARLDFPQAAAVRTFLTAWHMLVTRAHLQPGEDVLVLAAGSGVGSAGIQIAKLLGARVIATAGNEQKLELARSARCRRYDSAL